MTTDNRNVTFVQGTSGDVNFLADNAGRRFWPVTVERQEIMLRNAYRVMSGMRMHKGSPLWTIVSEVTSHGSTVSAQICRELGWNPDMKVGEPLPEATHD